MTTGATRRATLPLFLASGALSTFGNSSVAIVLPWLVLDRTGDPALTGLVAAAAAAPAFLAALVGGFLVDRVGQRPMSILADLGSAGAVAALAVVDRVADLDVTWFVVLGVLGAVFDVPGMTARETMVGRVSSTAGLSVDKIAGIRQGVVGLCLLAGPALAGVLLAVWDPIDVVWLTAGCSAAAALCTVAMPLVAPQSDESVDGLEVGGFQTVRRSRPLRAVLLIGFGGALISPPLVSVLLPAHFGGLGHPEWYGLTMSGFAVGSIVGATCSPLVLARSRWRAFRLSIVVVSVGMVAFAPLYGFWLVACGALLIGAGSGLMSPIFIVFFTEQVRESVRGRVLGLFDALTMLAAPLGLGAISWLLSVGSLQSGAVALLVVWLAVAAYSLTSAGMRTFAESGARPGSREEPVGVDH